MKGKRIVHTTFTILAIALAVLAQQPNSKDQALRGSGRVNPSTLAMEFDLPLGSYPGRGINMPVTLSYSSKVWRAKFIDLQPRVNNPDDCISMNVPKFAENSASGWTTSLATPYVEYVGWDNKFKSDGSPAPSAPCPDDAPSFELAVIKRIVVHLPSGETHELRVDDTPYTYPTNGSPPSKDGTYLATDSSNIKYVEDSGAGTYKILMPDGSFYSLKSTTQSYNGATIRRAERYTDRNGNYTTYNDSNDTWTDTLGRTLSPPLGLTAPSAGAQTYQLPGMGGSYTFRWKQLNGGTQEDSALTDIYGAGYQLKYMADRASTDPTATPRTSGYLFSSGWSAWLHDAGAPVFNPVVLAEIELPTGQKYKFTYDIYGRIERIYYPTGGEERFTYSTVNPLVISADADNVSDQMNFGVTDRKVYQTAGQGTPYEWTYSASYVSPAGYKVTVVNPDGTKSERYLYRSESGAQYGFEDALTGMAYEERAYDSANPAHLMSQKLTTWTKTTLGGDWHPRVTQEESRIYDTLGNGVSTTTTNGYAGNLDYRDTPVLQNSASLYGFVTVGSQLPANPLRTTESTFLIYDSNYSGVASNYTTQNMVGLVTVSKVKDGSGTVVAQSETVYDESGRSPGYRGNPTTARVWDSTKGVVTNSNAYIATSAKFDSYGNQYEATDALGNTTSTTFDSTYHAFPIQVTSPVPDTNGTYGSSSAFVTYATFDTTTGLPLTTTDANGLTTAIEYDSATLRPRYVRYFDGQTQVGPTQETVYHDESGNYWVKNRSQIDADHWAESITYFDGLGRAYRLEEVNSHGNIFVNKEFDSDGRVLRVSNPYRLTGDACYSSGTIQCWTTNVYDTASRVIEVDLPDGSKVLTDYGVSISGVIGVTKQITDQAGKKRKGFTDALGNMVRVVEDPDNSALVTDYVFDTLGNLRKTTQGDQNRYFYHDSLGRLLRARQVEQDVNSSLALPAADPVTGNNSWTVGYSYDDNSNITSTTDARNITITAYYDHLNRIYLRDYSDSTPDVTFYYDGKGLPSVPNYSKGKTTKVTSSISETTYRSFDIFGRLLTHRQTTDSVDYDTAYSYNLSGALIEQTYPSGRVVRNTIDQDGDLSQVQSGKCLDATPGTNATCTNRAGYWTYASGFASDAAGNLTKMQLGNGRWENFTYNNRSQVMQIGLGTTDSTQNLLKLEYGYGNNTQNNGSLRSQKISFDGLANSFEQTYSYDDLNRLQVAEEKVSGITTWKQTFTIDRYGNRKFDANNTTTLGSCSTAVCNPTISTANNRFSSGQGYSYDANGSVTQDATGQRFGYDAENHQKEFFATGNGGSTPDATYLYDGSGLRVKKVTASETTVFVYDASSKLIAEYSTGTAQTPQVSYLTTDHLGSPRVITNENGAVTSRKDFSAFGDETITQERTAALKYQPPEIRQDYTGYQKDEESGLEFAQARYYNTIHGRFTSVDPFTASATIRNPQTFNRYSYVLNSPYEFADPLGLISASTGACGDRCNNSVGGFGAGLVGLYSGSEVGQTILFGDEIVIDVFLAAAEIKNLNTDQIKQQIMKKQELLGKVTADQVTVNVYSYEQSTVDNILSSLAQEGRTVIVVGHSASADRNISKKENGGKDPTVSHSGEYMQVYDGYIGTKGAITDEGRTIREFPINAKNLFFFGCRLIPRSVDAMMDRFTQDGSSFVFNTGGDDGLVVFRADINEAITAAAYIASGRTAADSIPSLRAITTDTGNLLHRDDGNSVQIKQKGNRLLNR